MPQAFTTMAIATLVTAMLAAFFALQLLTFSCQ